MDCNTQHIYIASYDTDFMQFGYSYPWLQIQTTYTEWFCVKKWCQKEIPFHFSLWQFPHHMD